MKKIFATNILIFSGKNNHHTCVTLLKKIFATNVLSFSAEAFSHKKIELSIENIFLIKNIVFYGEITSHHYNILYRNFNNEI